MNTFVRPEDEMAKKSRKRGKRQNARDPRPTTGPGAPSESRRGNAKRTATRPLQGNGRRRRSQTADKPRKAKTTVRSGYGDQASGR
jgi:hypothetical protein